MYRADTAIGPEYADDFVADLTSSGMAPAALNAATLPL
jgi:hypothetical protein